MKVKLYVFDALFVLILLVLNIYMLGYPVKSNNCYVPLISSLILHDVILITLLVYYHRIFIDK
ncbi:MAG: hypothetical protein JNM96_05105 [Bacteroidia bacterium]|nr:hypothetical protein [Bacteroidia bacterium]